MSEKVIINAGKIVSETAVQEAIKTSDNFRQAIYDDVNDKLSKTNPDLYVQGQRDDYISGGITNANLIKLKDLVLFIHKNNLAVLGTTCPWAQYYEGMTPQRAIRVCLSAFKPNTKYVVRFDVVTTKQITLTGWHNIVVDDGSLPTTIPTGTSTQEWHIKTVDTTRFGQFKEYNGDLVWGPWDRITSIKNLFIMEEIDYDSSIPYEDFDGDIIAVPNINLKYSKYGTDYVFFNTFTHKWCKCDVIAENGKLRKQPIVTELSQTQHDLLTSISFLLEQDLSDYTVELIGSEGLYPYDIFKYDESEACHLSVYHTDGDKIKDEYGNDVIIRAMNDQGTEYKNSSKFGRFAANDITSLGFNTAQLHLYGMDFLEPDMTTEKEDYLTQWNTRVESFKRYGKRIIMKFYGLFSIYSTEDTSEYGSGKWWDVSNPEYREKMMKFQKYIVDMYKDDPYVIGYSIANEPGNAGLTSAGYTAYGEYINELVSYINTNAPTQLIFIENTTNVDMTKPNIVYEWHMYSPHCFTHMGRSTTSNSEYVTYPSTDVGLRYGSWKAGKYDYESTKTYYGTNWTGDWQDISVNYQKTYPGTSCVGLAFGFNNFGTDTRCVFDDPIIIFYDKDKNETRRIKVDIDKLYNTKQTNVKTGATSSCFSIVNGEASDGTGGLVVQNVDTTNDYRYQNSSPIEYCYHSLLFVPNDNDAYVSVIGKAKVTNPYDSSTRALYYLTEHIYPFSACFDRNFLRKYFDYRDTVIKDAGITVPLYIGETGTDAEKSCYLNYYTYKYQRKHLNGELYIADLLQEIMKRNLSFAYFCYNGSGFGIHVAGSNDALLAATNSNSRLWETIHNVMTDQFDETKLYWDAVDGDYVQEADWEEIKKGR